MVQQDISLSQNEGIEDRQLRWFQQMFYKDNSCKESCQNQLLEFFEKTRKLKVIITSENNLFGYHIEGGGAIDIFPRFSSRESAELDAIKLLFTML